MLTTMDVVKQTGYIYTDNLRYLYGRLTSAAAVAAIIDYTTTAASTDHSTKICEMRSISTAL